MPLYVTVRKDTGALEIRGIVKPAGEGQAIRVRRRAGTNDPKLAAEEARLLEVEILRGAYHGERRAAKTFSEAALSYLKHEERTIGTKALVRRLTQHFRDTPLDKINQEAVDRARARVLRDGARSATVKRNLIVPLRAIMLHAAKRNWCSRPNFDLPAEPRGRTAFLMPDQVDALIEAAAPHLRPLLAFLVCTGCRIGEAFALQWPEVDLRGARVILWEGETKGGSRRIVPLPPRAVATLASLPHREGHVFRTQHGEAYRQSSKGGGGQIRGAWATACRKAGLPGAGGARARSDRSSKAITFQPENTPHNLRHTWATWHYAVNKDLLRLMHDGGWSDMKLVVRYAHLMPAGMQDAINAVWGVTGTTAAAARA